MADSLNNHRLIPAGFTIITFVLGIVALITGVNLFLIPSILLKLDITETCEQMMESDFNLNSDDIRELEESVRANNKDYPDQKDLSNTAAYNIKIMPLSDLKELSILLKNEVALEAEIASYLTKNPKETVEEATEKILSRFNKLK